MILAKSCLVSVRQLCEAVSRIIPDDNPDSPLTELAEKAKATLDALAHRVIPVDVINLEEDQTTVQDAIPKIFASILGPTATPAPATNSIILKTPQITLSLRSVPSYGPDFRKAGDVSSPVAIVSRPNLSNTGPLTDNPHVNQEERAILVEVFNPAESKLINPDTPSISIYNGQGLSSNEVSLLHSLFLKNDQNTSDLLIAYTCTLSLNSILLAFSAVCAAEAQVIWSRKYLSSRRLARCQQMLASLSPIGQELLQAMRTKATTHFDAVRRECADRFEAETVNGEVDKAVKASTRSIGTITPTKNGRKRTYTLPAEVEQHLIATLRATLLDVLSSQISAVNQSLKALLKQQLALLSRYEIPTSSNSLAYQELSHKAVFDMINLKVALQRHVKTEVVQPGIFEVVMLAWRPYRLVGMAALVAGGSAVAYIHKLWPITVLLIAIGLYVAFRDTGREKRETQAREITRIQESVRGELSRIIKDVEATWEQLLSRYASTQINRFAGLSEPLVRDFFSSRLSQLNDDRQRSQNQLASADTAERKLGSLVISKTSIEREIVQAKTELRALLNIAISQMIRGQ